MALEDREHAVAVQRMLEGSKIVFDRGRARQMRKQAALVASEHLGDAGRAVDVYRELLAESESDAVAEAIIPELARLYGQLGAFSDLADLWEHQAERHAPVTPQISAELFTRAAELSEKRRSDLDRAIRDYERSAAAGSSNALRELARLHGKRGNHAKAAEALEGLSYQASQEHLVADTLALVDAYLSSSGSRRAQRLERLPGSHTTETPRRLRAVPKRDQGLSAGGAPASRSRGRRRQASRSGCCARAEPTKGARTGADSPVEQARKSTGRPPDRPRLTRAPVATAHPEAASAILRRGTGGRNREPKGERSFTRAFSRAADGRPRARAGELDLAAKIAPPTRAFLRAGNWLPRDSLTARSALSGPFACSVDRTRRGASEVGAAKVSSSLL
jgi:tetratricopeptide (TPR) repeat protein